LLLTLLFCLDCFFFFQAEDGIRDATVTGVQTCALPISRPPGISEFWRATASRTFTIGILYAARRLASTQTLMARFWPPSTVTNRSEERRVGKECRARGGLGQRAKRVRESSGSHRRVVRG